MSGRFATTMILFRRSVGKSVRKLSISNFIHVADLVVVLVLLSLLSIIVTIPSNESTSSR
jgi:hypothetical protein